MITLIDYKSVQNILDVVLEGLTYHQALELLHRLPDDPEKAYTRFCDVMAKQIAQAEKDLEMTSGWLEAQMIGNEIEIHLELDRHLDNVKPQMISV